jgi:hypothetical protein
MVSVHGLFRALIGGRRRRHFVYRTFLAEGRCNCLCSYAGNWLWGALGPSSFIRTWQWLLGFIRSRRSFLGGRKRLLLGNWQWLLPPGGSPRPRLRVRGWGLRILVSGWSRLVLCFLGGGAPFLKGLIERAQHIPRYIV